jgi:hypothetical protein
MTSYDSDGDGLLTREELASCPGLLAALSRYDLNGDSQISREELAARLSIVYTNGVPVVGAGCYVRYRGKPLQDAQVTYTPEPFLADSLGIGTGSTDRQGLASIRVSEDQFEDSEALPNGLWAGIYRIEITHPKVKLPAKFSGPESSLGHAVEPFTRDATGKITEFDLSSK